MHPPKNALGLQFAIYCSPIGNIVVAGDENGIRSVDFSDEVINFQNSDLKIIQHCIQQLDEYFTGKRRHFDLKLNPQGTDFQQKVWAQLQQINFGKTTTYGAIAKNLGDANLMRAVGMANGKNPIAIIIPCHRVIGTNGTLTGYAGGLERKKWLLEFEQSHRQINLF